MRDVKIKGGERWDKETERRKKKKVKKGFGCTWEMERDDTSVLSVATGPFGVEEEEEEEKKEENKIERRGLTSNGSFPLNETEVYRVSRDVDYRDIFRHVEKNKIKKTQNMEISNTTCNFTFLFFLFLSLFLSAVNHFKIFLISINQKGG